MYLLNLPTCGSIRCFDVPVFSSVFWTYDSNVRLTNRTYGIFRQCLCCKFCGVPTAASLQTIARRSSLTLDSTGRLLQRCRRRVVNIILAKYGHILRDSAFPSAFLLSASFCSLSLFLLFSPHILFLFPSSVVEAPYPCPLIRLGGLLVYRFNYDQSCIFARWKLAIFRIWGRVPRGVGERRIKIREVPGNTGRLAALCQRCRVPTCARPSIQLPSALNVATT